MYKLKPENRLLKANGFSLIEVAIVVIISGIILIPLVHGYEVYMAKQAKEDTETQMTNVLSYIGQFQSDIVYFNPTKYAPLFNSYHNIGKSRLPCPSDRSLSPGDPLYNREFNNGNCSLSDLAALTPPLGPLIYHPATGAPSCTPNGGFCIVRGSKTIGGVTTYAPVLIGGVPIKDLRYVVTGRAINQSASIDGWGGQMGYAVTLSLTSASTYGVGEGYLNVVDEFGNPTAGIDSDGDYLLFSTGPDKNGAFSKDGKLMSVCGASPYGLALENENCNNLNAKFVEALGSYQGAASSYYDDELHAVKNVYGSLWRQTTDGSGNLTNNIYNTNSGDVGIKNDTPSTKVDVNGNVRASTNAKVSIICDKSGSNCFNVSAITSSVGDTANTITCPPGQVMRGIYSVPSGSSYVTKADCVSVTFTPPSPGATCGTKWIIGIKEDGTLICSP